MKLYYVGHTGFIGNTTLESELARKTYIEHEEKDGQFIITFNTEDYYYNDYHEKHSTLDVKCNKEYFYTDWQKITEKLVKHTEEQIEGLKKHITDLRTYNGEKYNWNK